MANATARQLVFPTVLTEDQPAQPHEPKGVVYTKSWVAELILDLAGYREREDLGARYAVEPAAGGGAFFIPMVRRLIDSLRLHGRSFGEAAGALCAYELNDRAATALIQQVERELLRVGVAHGLAHRLAEGWVRVTDYLLASQADRNADYVVGNPPYIRYDDLPKGVFSAYHRLYPTMVGRGDIYVGFIEAGLGQLSERGVLAYICADRWMRSAYGADLRKLVTSRYRIDAMVKMHEAQAFETDVTAYPAIVVMRRGTQGSVVIASATGEVGPSPVNLVDALAELADGREAEVPGLSATRMSHWFAGETPWPDLPPRQLEFLQQLEERFQPLENTATGTKIGIGVATGNDQIYVTKDSALVERDRLLPLAMATDTRSGVLQWSGHYLVNPWDDAGNLVDLVSYPRLREYFERHRDQLAERHVARKQPRNWFRTIDRVSHSLIARSKLYFPDMKLVSNPTLDDGKTYPHHNLYYLTSDSWDLGVLGGILLSRIAQLFIEAYSVKMRGGTLRFQAQYLRRIRVPDPRKIPPDVCKKLRCAFQTRDVDGATEATLEAYGLTEVGHLL